MLCRRWRRVPLLLPCALTRRVHGARSKRCSGHASRHGDGAASIRRSLSRSLSAAAAAARLKEEDAAMWRSRASRCLARTRRCCCPGARRASAAAPGSGRTHRGRMSVACLPPAARSACSRDAEMMLGPPWCFHCAASYPTLPGPEHQQHRPSPGQRARPVIAFSLQRSGQQTERWATVRRLRRLAGALCASQICFHRPRRRYACRRSRSCSRGAPAGRAAHVVRLPDLPGGRPSASWCCLSFSPLRLAPQRCMVLHGAARPGGIPPAPARARTIRYRGDGHTSAPGVRACSTRCAVVPPPPPQPPHALRQTEPAQTSLRMGVCEARTSMRAACAGFLPRARACAAELRRRGEGGSRLRIICRLPSRER